MAESRSSPVRRGAPLVGSVLLHGVVIAIVVRTVTGGGMPGAIERETPHEMPADTEPPEELGIEESEAETVTWIGYEEYEEHLARLSEIDQAAMLATPAAGGGGAPPGSSASAAAVPAPPPLPGAVRPSSSAPASTAPSEPVEDADRIVDPTLRIDPTTRPTETPTESRAEAPNDASTEKDAPTSEPVTKPSEDAGPRETEDAPAETIEETSEESTPEPTPDSEPATDPAPDPGPAPSPTPTPSEAPTPAPQPEPSDEPSEEPGRDGGTGDGPASDGDGNDADKDSSPTSTVDTPRENWRNGRPLAAEGLDLQPKRIRPGHEIPALVLAQASLRANPVIELRFPRWSGSGRGVKPTSARVVSSTGDRTFDGYLLDALYGWLARGERLRDLGEGETRLVRLKLLMR
ncbi:MAG: hypothetical protein VX012_08040 [Planctomycetota bacterium]|nr:hypothetical protein [Planctomycetota bacterium]